MGEYIIAFLVRRLYFGMAVAVLLLSIFGGYRLNQGITARYKLAQSWSSDSIQVHASGPFNLNLSVTMLDDDAANDHVRCDLFVGEVLADRKLSKELKDAGFSTMQCGDLKVGIR
jgi:hypothetical protein